MSPSRSFFPRYIVFYRNGQGVGSDIAAIMQQRCEAAPVGTVLFGRFIIEIQEAKV